MSFIKKYSILIIIIVLAFVIRLVAGHLQSFSNDELSALYRLQFSHFSDLMEWGIKIDGHPALVQLFLYYYTPLVPKGEVFIRLPFILASTLSLAFIFFSLKKISGEFTAYMVIIILAFAGFSIQLGYFARPYAFGILFTSAAAYYWIRVFIEKEKTIKCLVLFIACSILSAYTHYFAVLEIVMLGMATFVFVHWKLWWKIILSGIIGFMAFLPHFSITKFQMSVGGIGGWLGKPKDYFIIDLLLEYFDRSPIIIGVFVMVSLILIILHPTKPKLRNTLLMGFLSIVPFCILYFYSIKINSVLQFSACFFLMPFLLGAFFSFFQIENDSIRFTKRAYGVCIFIFLCSSLVFNSAFSSIHFAEFKKIAKYIEEHESDSVTTIVAVNNPFYINYYLKDKKPDLYITDMGDDISFLKRYIDTCKTQEVIYAFANQRSNAEIPCVLADVYNYKLCAKWFMNSELYHFTKSGKKDDVDLLVNKLYFRHRYDWHYNDSTKKFVKSDNLLGFRPAFELDSTQEFSPSFTAALKDLKILDRWDLLNVQADVEQKKFCDLQLVISVENPGGKTFWRSRMLSDQIDINTTNTPLYITETFNHPEIDIKDGKLKIYIWNPNKCSCNVKHFWISIVNGNLLNTGYFQGIGLIYKWEYLFK